MCAHHAITNIFEEGRKAMDSVVHEMMNILDEMAATDAKKVKAMRTSVGVVLLAVLCAHLPVLEVRRPLLIQGVRHWRKVPAVARRGAPWQGGEVV
eukprot:4438707-Pleurochrysis_carterae.AAC.1